MYEKELRFFADIAAEVGEVAPLPAVLVSLCAIILGSITRRNVLDIV